MSIVKVFENINTTRTTIVPSQISNYKHFQGAFKEFLDFQ